MQPGDLIGPYRIESPIGKGGMGQVFKAVDTRDDRVVAVKVLHVDRLASGKSLKRFELEAKALTRLDHPNVVHVLDFGEANEIPFLVMEYMPGGTLGDYIGKPMSVERAAALLAPVAHALHAAHQEDIVHRDVKPANILLGEDGEPRLSDFGIAKLFNLEETLDLTVTGVGLGTPAYMAPEQTQRTFDHRVDIYSLGVILFELVTGRKPFTGETPIAIMMSHTKQPLPDPKQFAPTLSKRALKVIRMALAKNPVDRYQDMAQFARALEVLAGIGERRSFRDFLVENLPAKFRSRRSLIIALAVLFGCVALLTIASLGGGGKLKTFFNREQATPTESIAMVQTKTEVNDASIALVEEPAGNAPSKTPTLRLTASPLPIRTRTSVPTITATRTRMSFYRDYDFAFASDKTGDFRVYLTHSDNFSDVLEVPLPEGYQSAWYPSFCAAGIGMEVTSRTVAPAKWIYIYYPDDGQFYRWEDKPPYTALAVPRCSSDGAYFAYSAFLNDEYFLQVAKLDNEDLLFELEDTYPDASESYTSGYAIFPLDGNTFISMANLDRSQFYTMLLTTDFQRTTTLGFGKFPAFSPDGKQIAYLCNQENSLCISSLGGSPTALLTLVSNLVRGATMPMGTPWWSRDGQWIYFSSSDGGDWDIYRIRPDGSERTNLTEDWSSNELMPVVRW